MKKSTADAIINVFGKLKDQRDKVKVEKDNLAKVVAKLTRAEFDALPKALQKELSEYR